jgi:selenocysteine lyase/cysteine desulfurase
MTEHYPILSKYTYLDTANHGLISNRLLAHRRKLDARMQNEASLFVNQRNFFIDGVRETVAGFIDADPGYTAVIPNFSLGYNILIESIDPASRFLLLENDYPSLNLPIESRGFKRHYVPIDEHLEARILAACKEHEPDFFCFSIVQYISGIMINLDFLRDLKAQYPDIVLIADGTQYVGVEEFRFRESGIDIILASCYKWLHAGDGHGFIAVKPMADKIISARHRRFRSAQNITQDKLSFISRFELGHQDMLAFGTLQEAILQAQDLGWDFIENTTQAIATKAKEAFSVRNLLAPAVVNRTLHSTIFNITGDKELHDKLQAHAIVTSLRGNGIRVSFSYFNTQNDLNKLIKVLDL